MAYLQIPSVFDIKMAEQLGDCARLNACGGKPSLVYQTKTDLVLYSGSNLSCTTIQKCTNTTEIFQKFNDAICPETITTTIINAIINSTTLSDLLCNEVIQKCVTCDDFKDCITCDVILECTSTTTSTTTINLCRCITFSNIGTDDGIVLYDACPGSFASGINLPVGAVVQICGSNPRAGDGGAGFDPTWVVGDSCIKVGQYDVCNDDCCEYTITRNDPGTIFVDFINCFGYYNETLEIQDGDPLPTFCALDGQVFIFGPGTAVKNNCTCVPTCQCYEADTTGGGNFYLRWLSCDGVDKAQSIFNEVYQICATPGTVDFAGTGSFSLTPLLTPCTLDTDCWEEFVMDATNVSGTLIINQVGATGRYAIEWEPGVFTFYNTPGVFARSYTYTTPYTGPIKIKAPSLAYITRLMIFGPGNFTSPSGQGIDITGPEIAKLTSLQRLNIGFQCNARVFCDTTDLSSVMTEILIYKGNLSGNLYDGVNPTLAPTITNMGIFGTSTVFGDIQYLPPNLTNCTVLGANNLNGDLVNLPPSLAASLTYLQIEGSNDITGDIGSLGTYTSLTYLRILGENTIDGDILGISPLINLTAFMVYGKNGLSGNLSALIPLTVLNTFVVDNDDSVLGPPGIGNTITGLLSSLPASLEIFIVGKFNTIGGDLADIPSGMIQFVIRQTTGGVITGSLASITTLPLTEFSLVGGSHTFSGTILQLPPTLKGGYFDTSGAVSGDLADLPTGITNFTVISGSIGSIFTYTSPRTWAPTMGTMDIVAPALGIPTAQLNDLFIDLDASNWVVITILSTYGIRLRGSFAALSPAAQAAFTNIQSTPTNVVLYP